MKKAHASKKSNDTLFRLIRCCPFCGSVRVAFEEGDDDGPYVAVRCSGCCAVGPHTPARIWEGEITDVHRHEAAAAWNAIFDQMTPRPDEGVVDRHCNEVKPRRDRRLRAPEPAATADHHVHAFAPPKGTSGHNGHNGHHNGTGAL